MSLYAYDINCSNGELYSVSNKNYMLSFILFLFLCHFGGQCSTIFGILPNCTISTGMRRSKSCTAKYSYLPTSGRIVAKREKSDKLLGNFLVVNVNRTALIAPRIDNPKISSNRRWWITKSHKTHIGSRQSAVFQPYLRRFFSRKCNRIFDIPSNHATNWQLKFTDRDAWMWRNQKWQLTFEGNRSCEKIENPSNSKACPSWLIVVGIFAWEKVLLNDSAIIF